MKKIITFVFVVFLTMRLFGQSNNYCVLYLYSDKDLYSKNKIGKLFINDTLRIGVKGGHYDTLRVKPNCYRLSTNKNKEKIDKCFNPEQEYYYKIVFKYIFLS